MGHYDKLSEEQKEKVYHKVCNMLDEEQKRELEDIIYVTVHGEHLSDEMAKDWVKGMVNKDGSTGEHFSWETAKALKDDYNISDLLTSEVYAVMNMMWSDYYDVIKNDTDSYIKLTRDWLTDKDAPEGKTYKYFKIFKK